MTPEIEAAQALAAVRSGDQAAFAALSERYRRQLRAHCYRMLGSFDDAEDMVQETMLRAWRGREGFEGRSLFRTWLYRIATNACLNALERAPARVLPQDVTAAITADTPGSEARSTPPLAPEIPWLQPYPDQLLEPEALLGARQTIELAFLAALQHLPARQRAILILADVVGWSAAEIAELLALTVPAVTSALQRAHTTVRTRLPAGQQDGTAPPTAAERAALRSFMDAWEQGDASVLTRLLREDARWAMPPALLWFDGRAAIVNMLAFYPPHWQGRAFKMLATAANGQLAAAAYLRPPGGSAYGFTGVHVLRVEGREIAEITTFAPALCAAFALPDTL